MVPFGYMMRRFEGILYIFIERNFVGHLNF